MFLAMMFTLLGSPDLEKLVRAIEVVEASPWTSQGGGLQFTTAAWREMTSLPYDWAKRRHVARSLAAERLARDARRLRALGIEPTPYLLGMIWNKGFNGALRLQREGVKVPYAERVDNVFHDPER